MQAPRFLVWAIGIGLVCGSFGCGDDKGSGANDNPSSGARAGSGASSGAGADPNTGATASEAGSPGMTGDAGSGAELPAPEEHSYDADDPLIQYMGRMDWTDAQAPRFAASAAQLRVKFQGTGATVKILDENRYGQNKNYF